MGKAPNIKWTDELEDSICAAIAVTPEGLEHVCKESGFPDPKSIYRRIIASESFRDKYARAKEMQLQVLADQIVPLADKDRLCEKRTIKADGSEEVVILDQVERTKLQIEARKWLLGKLAPKKYGDKIEQFISGPEGKPIQASITVELVKPNGNNPTS